MKIILPKYQIREDKNFEDILQRENFAKRLTTLISDIDTDNDGLVLSLEAPWGEGKTTFVKNVERDS